MKNIIAIACTVLFFSCNQSGSNKGPVTKNDSLTTTEADTAKKGTDKVISNKTDTASLIKMSNEILMAAKTRNFQKFASFIHPQKGIHFYPFSYIDTANKETAKAYSGEDLVTLAKQKKRIDWGSGFAEPEKLTVDQFFVQCVYDKDYLIVGNKSVNMTHRGGTAEGFNFKEAFAGHDFTEFFSPGTEKNGNMDWSAVRLVFETKDNIPYLIAIVYDHWTP